ncbi:hypothetical protein GWN91_06100, partial [Candidatus Saccharibacteria bacterium]|nr:hypothetical protein [Candidatus Saccharibacteria bacterium]NIV72611.1 hypothetical protein [Calditrichia bacterium]NIW80104.1 hypothetical protein [Calditrichia bacterium]
MIFGCTSKVTTGPFKKVEKLETALKRGISTKADVKKLLGEPNGYGHSFLPVMSGQKQKPNEIWYYENIEAIESRSSDPHVVELDVRQQILLIFFDQD